MCVWKEFLTFNAFKSEFCSFAFSGLPEVRGSNAESLLLERGVLHDYYGLHRPMVAARNGGLSGIVFPVF